MTTNPTAIAILVGSFLIMILLRIHIAYAVGIERLLVAGPDDGFGVEVGRSHIQDGLAGSRRHEGGCKQYGFRCFHLF